MGAEAKVHSPATECGVTGVWAGDVEFVGSFEHLFVAVGRQVVDQDPITFRDLVSADFDVTSDGAPKVRDRCCPPQQLLHRRFDGVGVAGE